MTGSSINFSAYGTSRSNVPAPVQPNNGDIPMQLNAYGELIVAQGSPQYLEENRQGELICAQDPTARASVVAIPTTTAIWSLQNGEDAGGKCYILDRITGLVVANVAAASVGLVMNLQRTAAVLGTNVANFGDPSGKGAAYGGKARVANAIATALAADVWSTTPACNANLIASGFGTMIDTGPLEGRIIIRPGRQLHVASISSATTTTVILTFWFVEKFIPGLV